VQKSIIFIAVLWFFWLIQPVKIAALEIDEESYKDSVHGTLVCISCHNGATGKTGEELQEAVSDNCVSCHTGARFDYERSIHSEAEYGPNCVTCHGDHYIAPATDASSPVYLGNVSETCGDCHQGQQVSFEESFHGKAVALGSNNAPDCTYCHNSHDVLSGDNPVALISDERKTVLCGECHEGDALGAQFTEHYKMEAKGPGAPMYWVKKVFMWLILIVVGFFLLHIELDLWHKLRIRNS